MELASFADDNTPYTCSQELQSVLNKLQEGTKHIFNWFLANRLKSNADKCHLLTSSDSSVDINVSNVTIKNETRVKLLGVHIDNDLNFDFHVEKLCNMASKKLHALMRVCKYMETNKRRMLMKAFIVSQFSYCPLIWMFHSKTMEHRINKIHEKALRLVYDNSHDLSFEELLTKDKSVSIHQRNLQTLATEIFKVRKGLSPSFMSEIFHFVEKPYKLRNNNILQRKRINTVSYGTQSLSSLGSRIWELIPQDIKETESLEEFKAKIKTWKTDQCPCRLCKKYIAGVGFI